MIDAHVTATELDPVPPGLQLVARVCVDLGAPVEVGSTPRGVQRIIPIIGGTVSGPALTGAVLPAGADWQTVLPDGTAVIEARYALSLVDDSGTAHVATLDTRGVRTGPPDVLAALRRGDTVIPDAYYFRFAATASTASPAHQWMVTSVLVASAVRLPDRVSYDLYRLT